MRSDRGHDIATRPSGQRRNIGRARFPAWSTSPLRQVCNRAHQTGVSPEEPFGSASVFALLNEDIDDISVLVDSAPKIPSLTLNRYGDFIEEPTITAWSIGLLDPPCVMRSKGYTPLPNSFVGYRDSTFSKQILDVAKTECESMMPGKGTTSRPLPPLRTMRESFPSHRSSLSRASDLTRCLSE